MSSEQHHFVATCPGGLEGLLADELTHLGAVDVSRQQGGVGFNGPLGLAYRACLWSRVGNRVLLPLARFAAADAEALYAGARELDWTAIMRPGSTIAVRFGGIRPAVSHTHYGSLKVKDALVDSVREATGERPDVDVEHADLRVHVYQVGEAVTLSLDLSGESLHRRGYRRPGTMAPLKENLAAAMLLRAGWPDIAAAGGPLVDPFCGSGTLLVEGACMAGDVAPGLLRTPWGVLGWQGHDDACWKDLVDEALERREQGLPRVPPIIGYDHDAQAVRTALQTMADADLAGTVHVERRELVRLEAPAKANAPGLVVTNPPYGERLGSDASLVPLYARLGEVLRREFPGWTAMVLNGAGAELGLRPDRRWSVRNGPIQCSLERFVLGDAGRSAVAGTGEAEEDAAAPLVNRLRKNQRKLKGWLKRTGVSCYRLYDADIPEYALAVDRYQTLEAGPWLHVQEYAAPKSVDARDAGRRLRQALGALPAAADVAPEQVTLKVRQRQKGKAQYQRQGQEGRYYTVDEAGTRLLVNFTDYLDTGLFLDHRPVREWIGANISGRSFLNLFAYTGAATVHAARGGASRTVSVDLSKTYLDWARRNLEANGQEVGRTQRLVHGDCLKWLHEAAEGGRDTGYDVILLDPPSFSNSARMKDTLDVQRDHAALIRAAARLLSDNGVLIFSTNLRRFRLETDMLHDLRVEDRTDWSIPPDFERNQRIHRCWFIRR